MTAVGLFENQICGARQRGALARKSGYFGLESGGHSGRTAMGLPPCCTVGAAEPDSPPASGNTALFSIAMEFDLFSPALPVVTGEVVQFVSGFAFDCVEV
jgi:hypothetical protein